VIVAGRSPRAILLVIAVGLSFGLTGVGSALAAEFTVNSTADTTECAAACTLRGAIAAASKSAEASNTIIVDPGTYVFGPAEKADPTHTGELRLTNPPGTTLTIRGAGVGVSVIDAAKVDRVMRVSGGGTDILEGLTLEQGYQHEDEAFEQEDVRGAGIRQTGGELTLDLVRVTDDANNGSGGGIDVQEGGVLNLIDSEIDHDVTSVNGGGAVDLQPGTLDATDTTFDNDTAGVGEGGAVQLLAGSQASFTNDTLADDGFVGGTLTYEGGGVNLEESSASFTNVTFSGDIAGGSKGGGSDISANEGSDVSLTNVLLGPRSEEEAGEEDCNEFEALKPVTWSDLGGNLSADTSCKLGAADMGVDIKLGELGNNGGPTPTVPLLEGSPAINNGVAGCPPTDQRGYARVGICDSGAFEFGGTPPGTKGTPSETKGTPALETPKQQPAPGGPSAEAIEALLLGCGGGKLALNDVYIHGKRVVIRGSAAKSLVGRKVRILLNRTRQVASARVQPNGQYATTAPLPPATIRDRLTNRYAAAIGTLRSPNLKLTRRLLLEAPKAAGTNVTLTGQIELPLRRPIAPVAVEQELECGKATIVKSFTPPASGHYHVTLSVPAGTKAAIFRLESSVAANKHSVKHGFTTYSLPLPVVLG
jgi:CSLREA domain-containing protein